MIPKIKNARKNTRRKECFVFFIFLFQWYDVYENTVTAGLNDGISALRAVTRAGTASRIENVHSVCVSVVGPVSVSVAGNVTSVFSGFFDEFLCGIMYAVSVAVCGKNLMPFVDRDHKV